MNELKLEEKNKILLNIWMRFNSNIGALYSFFEKVTELADESDKNRIKEIASKVAGLFGDKNEEVEKEISSLFPSIDDLDIYPDIRNNDSVKEMMEELKDGSFIKQVSEWEKKHPFKSQKFVKILYSAFADPPMSGVMLRKSMLITLLTFLEILIQDVFVNYSLMRGETKQKAKEFAKEMSKGGWGKRFSNLEKIGLFTQVQSKYKNDIIEMVKRRNLLVHNDGVVDESYLENAPQKHKTLKPGSILIVSTRYFQQAINIVYAYGLFLCLASWKANNLSEKEQSVEIDKLIIPTLNQKRYSLVLEITSNLKSSELSSSTSGRLLVDRAIAFRELGETNQVNKMISELRKLDEHWSIFLSIEMLTNNIAGLQKTLKDNRVPPNISNWPLFDPVKNEIWFKQIFLQKNRRVMTKPRNKR